MALNNITYFPIFGVPLIAYLGIITISLVVITFYLGYRMSKGKGNFKWHMRFATIALAFALIHGSLGVLAFL